MKVIARIFMSKKEFIDIPGEFILWHSQYNFRPILFFACNSKKIGDCFPGIEKKFPLYSNFYRLGMINKEEFPQLPLKKKTFPYFINIYRKFFKTYSSQQEYYNKRIIFIEPAKTKFNEIEL